MPDSKLKKKKATESDYVLSLKRGFCLRLETLEPQEVLPENWFLKDGSLRDHGLDSEVEDLDKGRLSKDVFFSRCTFTGSGKDSLLVDDAKKTFPEAPYY